MAATPPLHASQRLALHIREANASLTKQWIYVILNPERRWSDEKNHMSLNDRTYHLYIMCLL
jgi:hypothetical protein